jgi:hypothetical protein
MYHGELGEVVFVVVDRVGDPALDWYMDQYPNGGFMVKSVGFGSVFLTARETCNDLELLSRAEE